MNPKHHQILTELIKSGALDVQNGKVIMHFNEGELMLINADIPLYKHPQKPTIGTILNLSPTIAIGFIKHNMVQ